MDAAISNRPEKPGNRRPTATENTPTDAELLARIQNGEEGAFNLLYERYFKRVYGFVYRRLNNPADVEETTQEVFINLLSSLHSFRGEGTFAAWVFGITRRVIANRFKRKRHPVVPLIDEGSDSMEIPASTHPTPLEEYECVERFEQMRESMERRLNEEQRVLFRMHHIEERPISEIAQCLHKSEDAIKSNLYRARRLLLSR